MLKVLHALVLLGFVGCASDKTPRTDPGDDPPDTGSVPGDDPPDTGSDTGDDSSDTGSDTGEPSPPPPEPVEVIVHAQPVVCEDPEQRVEQGPMQLSGPGGDWDDQNGLTWVAGSVLAKCGWRSIVHESRGFSVARRERNASACGGRCGGGCHCGGC